LIFLNSITQEVFFLSILPASASYPGSQFRTHYTDLLGLRRLSRRFASLISCHIRQPHVLLCLGSDRSTGDSLGPLTGTKVNRLALHNISVYGTLANPVHAHNLQNTLQSIKNQYEDPFVIALDATLGNRSSVGTLTLSTGPIHPGSALKRRLPPVGDIHLTGVVNVNRIIQSLVLQSTRLDLVWQLSDLLCDMISNVPYYQIFRP
jgi:putative sporulation protein YyaC